MSPALLLAASTNASVLPSGDSEGSNESEPRRVDTAAQRAVAAEQISTDFVIQA